MCCSGNQKMAFLTLVAEAQEKMSFMITRACTITCRLRKSLHAIHQQTEKPIGYLLTNYLLTIINILSHPICLLLRLSLIPLLWGGDRCPRYCNALLIELSLHVAVYILRKFTDHSHPLGHILHCFLDY